MLVSDYLRKAGSFKNFRIADGEPVKAMDENAKLRAEINNPKDKLTKQS